MEQQQPKEIAFIPFDDIQHIIFAGPALFRAAQIFYDSGRPDEIVLVPLLYGISCFTKSKYDWDGSMTRFCCHVNSSADSLGIGIGHQDLVMASDQSRTVFGVGSVAQIVTALEMADPHFDRNAVHEGLIQMKFGDKLRTEIKFPDPALHLQSAYWRCNRNYPCN